jgi:hypothetical protein
MMIGGGSHMHGRLPRFIVEGVCMGEHGLGVKVSRETGMVGEESVPKGVGGMVKGCAQFMSPL